MIAGEHHAVAIFGVDPELVVIVAAGRAFDGSESLAAVGGHVSGGVDHISAVGVGRVDGDAAEIPATAPEAILVIDEFPGGAGVVGDIDAA